MPKQPSPDQFSDEEMEQMKRYGAAQIGGSDFSAEVEKHLNALEAKRGEANAAKMRAAQTGAPDVAGLGPSDIDTAKVKQRGAMQQQADTQGAAQAQQAQAAQVPANTPPAPAGPQGTTTTYPAQKGAVGGGGNIQPPPASAGPPPPAPGPGGPPPPDQGDEEQGPPQ